MDVFLTRLTQQAMNYAMRSGIAITTTYAMRQSARLLKNLDGEEREELKSLQQRLNSKIQVISPAIDMIELIAARGNTSLESSVALTKSLRWDIQALGQRLARAASSSEAKRKASRYSKDSTHNSAEIKLVIRDTKTLLARIEDAVPLLNLAITTSGAKLSTNLPSTVSPSRLLQSSFFLNAGDTQYSMLQSQAVQIGPTFTLSMYMLFAGHMRPHDEESVREATWKEVIHKAQIKLRRVPMELYYANEGSKSSQFEAPVRADEYAYQLLLVEDLDDGRVHTFEDNEPQPHEYEGVESAGCREILPIHQISKIFYADTSRILNISSDGETNNPVLLLKRDLNALPPRRMMEREDVEDEYAPDESGAEPVDEEQAQLDSQLGGGGGDPENSSFGYLHEDSIPEERRLPSGLDPEWIAFEVYHDEETSDTESEPDTSNTPARESPIDPNKMEKLSLNDEKDNPSSSISRAESSSQPAGATLNPIAQKVQTNLSLLEILLRLTSLQQFQQQPHLAISDELLNFFLEESSTTGAGGDEQHRQRLRSEARRRVGWDPYDESPVKRRGEDYQYTWGPDSPSAYPREGDQLYSPGGDTPRGFQFRSRENTPETPPRRGSPGVRNPSGLRGMTPAYSDGGHSRHGSPLAKKTAPAKYEDAGTGTAE
ncbi:hypothetical protein N7532_008616 [Penicillium argentinense]|uniref:RanGTP-binding protein n=1 Tax=Penicillium argentinense TaxID=1131581 RepID=A0A9W9EXR9_9EURO|nr:uncharacterized protein N7532_008616 [Penicillium argentinense]KAJ5089932.1 hypothetical protein N7532_008616 [Penicillium argentinense]